MRGGRLRSITTTLIVAATLAGCVAGAEARRADLDPDQVREWIEVLYPLPMVERLSPPVASRLHGYAGVALYQVLQHADSSYPGLDGRLAGLDRFPSPPEDTDWPVAAAEAERTVLQGLLDRWALPSTLVMVDTLAEAQVERRRAAGVDEAMIGRSLEFGRGVARVLLARADRDGFDETRDMAYDPPEGAGLWVNTTTLEEYAPISASEASQLVRTTNPSAALVPGAANARQMVLDRPSSADEILQDIDPTLALEPYWDRILPWSLPSAEACAPPPPVPWSDEPGSPFWREVEAVYETSMALTPEQRLVALFWADNPGVTGTPPGHWVSIMRQLVRELDLDPLVSAEMFAFTGMAIADAFVSAWAEKYRSNVVRPVSYIREHMDPMWETVVVTPPFPEYPSGHSVVSGAAAETLTALLGDSVAFTDSTHIAAGIRPRPYSSFHEAAKEASMSRLYGGIHYPMAVENGIDQGHCVARTLLNRVGAGATQSVAARPGG